MLDVHPPHHPAHTWKDFFIHVGTICVGLLIAVGLEQTVEYFHHRHQAHQLEDSLLRESLANQATVLNHLRSIDRLLADFKVNAARLNAAPSSDGSFAFVFPQHSDLNFFPYSITAWLSVRDSGSLALLPATTVSNYRHVEDYQDEIRTNIRDFFATENDALSLTHLHGDISYQSPDEKSRLLLAINRLDALLRHMRSTTLAFGACNEMAIHGEEVTPTRFFEYEAKFPPPPAP